jgi:hypothetical protein
MTAPHAVVRAGNTGGLVALIAALIFAASGSVSAQDTSPKAIPLNAHPGSYGSSWECDYGYRSSGTACIKISLPANAYFNGSLYGAGWDCNRGFRRLAGACVAITLPDHTYLNSSGSRWECERGYRRSPSGCDKILVPANGYLTGDAVSTGWKCEHGYRAQADECVEIVAPANGYLSERSYGSGWECKRGFREQDGAGSKRTFAFEPGLHLDY